MVHIYTCIRIYTYSLNYYTKGIFDCIICTCVRRRGGTVGVFVYIPLYPVQQGSDFKLA